MTPDYRAMCAELVDAMTDDSTGCWQREADVLDRARALLAQPVAEGPTDDEIHDFIALWWEDFGKGYLPCSSDKPLVKAALARWGRPAAAQAVLDAYWTFAESLDRDASDEEVLAVALRAAALCCKRDSAILLSLADELEGLP